MSSINSTTQTNNQTLSELFSNRYNVPQTPQIEQNSTIKPINEVSFDDNGTSQKSSSLSRIEDTFTPSDELSAAMNAKSYVINGLADINSFRAMANQLQTDGILNRDDMMAVDFLATKSPNISLKDFDSVIRNENLSQEMRGLISQLVQKLHMMNYLSGGAMGA